MAMDRAMRTPGASVLLQLKPPANARSESDLNAGRIAPGYANLAGSDENVLALIHALHQGTAVSLRIPSGPGLAAESVDIVPPTGAMSWKDVKMALMLVRDALQRYGIVHPTGAQLRAAITGGQVSAPNGKPVSFRGVLRMRAEGMNWGRIAAERFRRPEVTIHRHTAPLPEFVRA
jgi:hypothetical protein